LVTPADLGQVRHSSSFHEYFLEVTRGHTTALERAITIVIADRDRVTLSEIQGLLAENGFNVSQSQLEKAVSGLRLYNILFKEGQQYAFASGAFAQIVRESLEVDILLNTLRNEMQEQTARGDWRLQ